MRLQVIYVWLIFILFLQGCIGPNKLTEQQDQRVRKRSPEVSTPTSGSFHENQSHVSVTETATPFATQTSVVTSTMAVTLEPTGSIRQPCFVIREMAPNTETSIGKIALFGRDIYENETFHNITSFYDPLTSQITTRSPDKAFRLVVSPDRLKYAIHDASDGKIQVLSVDGKQLKTIPNGKYPYTIDGWLDNEQLALVQSQKLEGTQYYQYPRTVTVVNLGTNEQKIFPPDYPQIDHVDWEMAWEGGSTTKYDPQLTRVVYAAGIEQDHNQPSERGYILWDLVNGVKLAQIVTGNYFPTPKWAPDGSKLTVNNGFGDGDFYVITRDGMISRVSHLNSDKDANQPKSPYFFSDVFSWSPDGRWLAFWLEDRRYHPIKATFAVLDTYTGEVTDTCLSYGDSGESSRFLNDYSVPFWSPDGKLIVTIANMDRDGNFDTLLIHLEGGYATKISENHFPVGWLAGAR